MNKGLLGKVSLIFIVFLLIFMVILFFGLPAFASIQPSIIGVSSFLVNISSSDANQTDEFFTCGNVVYLRFNISCANSTKCNSSLTATANYSAIGGNQVREGVVITNSTDGTGGWRLFEFNDTVNCSVITISNFQMANITVNASTYDGNTTSSWAGPVLVNMSTMTSCPPDASQIPPQVPLLNGSFIAVSGCSQSCTGDDHAEYNGTHWNACGPSFGGGTTNFSQVAYNGNFSNVPLVIDIPGKVKINFSSGVNMSDQNKSSAIMQFAMKNMMAGSRVGINESEWNGQDGKPNLNLSASITIYNFSGRFGIPSNIRPSISRRATYGNNSDSFLPCPTGICSGVTWDGQNLTFTVASFSEYNVERGLSVVLSNTTGLNFNSSINTSYSNTKNINFSYTSTWNSTINPQTVTLWGNFTGTWAANVTNSTNLNNATLNYINTTVGNDGVYLWNIVINDTTGGNDTHVVNWTVVVDTANPTITNVAPANGSYFNNPSTRLFQVTLTETNKNNSINVTVYYRRQDTGPYQSAALICYGSSSPYTCNKTIDITPYVANGEVLQYLFNTTDLAGNTGNNGTAASPLTATVDTASPTSVTSLQHTDDAPTGYDNDTSLAFTWAAATDASGIQKYRIYVSTNSGAFTYTADNDSATDYTLTGSNGNNYAINVTSVDNAGNENTTGTVSSTIIVDTVKPAVTSAAVNNTVLRTNAGLQVNVTVTDTNRNTSNVKVSGNSGTTLVSMAQIGGSDVFSVGTTPSSLGCSADAACTLTFYVTDLAGNLNSSVTTVITTDNTNPASFNFVSSTESNNANKSQNWYYVNVTFAESNPDQCFVDNGATNTSMTLVGTTHCYKNMTSQSDGTYTYKVYMNDTAGNWGSSSTRTVNLDTVNPSVTANPTTYVAGKSKAKNDDTITLNATVTDASPSTNISTVTVNAATLGCAADLAMTHQGSGIYTATCLLSGATSGTKSLTVTATDYATNSNSTIALTVEVDVDAPTIDLTYPSNNVYLRGSSFNITGAASDGSADTIVTNNTKFATLSGTYTSWNFTNTSALTDGSYSVMITANDTAGNSNYTIANFTIDTANPTITNVAPANGSYFNNPSTRLFQVTLTETNKNNSINVTVYYRRQDTGPYQSAALICYGSSSPYTCNKTIDITPYVANGEVLQYLFNTTDLAGNTGNNGTAASPLTATVDTASPTYANNNTNATNIAVGNPVLIFTQWSDNLALRYAWLSTNETGSWQNKTTNYSSPASLSGLSSWSNFTWQNASVATGTIVGWKIYANDSAGNENVTATGTFTIDGAAPTYASNDTSVANNTEYTPSRNYGFQIDWTDNIAVSDVVFQWGANNYTYLGSGGVSKSGDTTYYYNLTNLAAGTYYYKWYANDTSNNWNSSFSNITYVVNLNQSNPVDIYIVNSTGTYKNQNVTITYGTSVTANVTHVYSSSGTAALYRDGSTVIGANETVTLAANTAGYAYKANVTGNANYTSNTSGITYYLTVNNGTLLGSIAGSNVTYPTAVNIGPAETNTGDADVNYTFWRNSTLVSSATGSAPSADATVLAAATYVYILNSTGGANYSLNSSIATRTITVSQASNPTNLYINNGTEYANQNVIITYGTGSNITGTCGSAPGCHIYINDTQKDSENSTLITRAAGLYMVKVNTSDNANYSAYSQQYNLTVNLASSPLIITANQSSPINYETSTNVTGYNCPAQITCRLYRNDTGLIGSGTTVSDNVLLGVGAYTYTYNTSGNENYSSNSTTFDLLVNAKNANVRVYPQTQSIPYGTSVTQYCLDDSSLYTCSMWRGATSVTNDTSITLAAGVYSYVANITDTSNYTNYQDTETLTVNNGTLLGSIAGSGVNYSAAVNIGPAETNTGDADVNYTFWRNSTLVNVSSTLGIAPANDTTLLGVGVYVYVLNSTGGANYSSNASIATLIVTVSINSSTSNYMNLTLGVGTSGSEANLAVMYPNTTNATGWYNSNSFTGSAPAFTLYRNDTNINSTNPVTDNNLLGAGIYVYVYNTSGNTNYSSASKNFTLTVNINSSNPIDLYLNNGTEYKNQNVTITYGTQINATALMTYSGRGSASLYRGNSNVTDIENGTAVTLAASTYVYVANTSGNANYSENATGSTFYVFVNKGPTLATLYLNGSTGEQTSIYPNSTINATAVSNVTGLYVQLWRNGTLINNATNTAFNITQWGAYNNNFTTKILGNENYSDSSVVTLWWNASKANSPLVLLNNTSWTVIYPTSTNITGSGCPSTQIICSLYRNDTSSIGSGATVSDNVLLGVGAYNYTYNTSGGENYSSNSTSNALTISKGTPSLTLSSSPSWSPTDVQATTVTCSATSQNNEVSANLYRNGTDVNSTQNGIAQFYVVGVYNYTCNTTATANYSTNSTSQIMTVTGTKGSVEGYIADSSGGSGIQGATVFITGYSPVATTASGYYLITGIIPGTYNVTVDKSNYTSNSTPATVTAGVTTQKNMTMTSTITSDTTPPNNPSSVNVTQVSGTRQVNISWSASTSSDTVRYNVYYKLSGSVTTSDNSVQVGNVTKTSVTVAQDGNWNFTVTAIDSSNNENTTIVTSVSVTVTTSDSTAPLQPTSLVAVQVVSTKQVNITWTASTSSDATGYYVYRSTGAVTTSSTNLGETGNTTRFTDTVPSDGTWNYTVVAHDAVPNVNTTITASASVNVTTDTTAPTISSITTNVSFVRTNAGVLVNVSASDDVAVDSITADGTNLITVSGSYRAGAITITQSTEGTHTIVIVVNDTANNKQYSSAYVIVDNTGPTEPIITSPSNNSKTNNTLPTITWSASVDTSSGVASYIIQNSTIATFTTATNNTVTTTSYTYTAALPVTTNYFRVLARDSAGNEGSWSGIVVLTVDTIVPTISDASPANNATKNSKTVTIGVKLNEDGTCRYATSNIGYDAMGDYMTETDAANDIHNATVTVTQAGIMYTYFVRCRDTAGNDATGPVLINFTSDDVAPSFTWIYPKVNDTVTTSTPNITVTTSEQATCKWDVSAVNYTTMANTMADLSTTNHTTAIGQVLDGWVYRYVSCQDTLGNNMDSNIIAFKVDTGGNFNITIGAAGTNKVWGDYFALGWNTFWLTKKMLENTTLAYASGTYNVTNVLASVAGNYTIIYYNPNETSTTWTSYTPGVGSTLTTFNDQTGYRPYWIYINVTNERLQIN